MQSKERWYFKEKPMQSIDRKTGRSHSQVRFTHENIIVRSG